MRASQSAGSSPANRFRRFLVCAAPRLAPTELSADRHVMLPSCDKSSIRPSDHARGETGLSDLSHHRQFERQGERFSSLYRQAKRLPCIAEVILPRLRQPLPRQPPATGSAARTNATKFRHWAKMAVLKTVAAAARPSSERLGLAYCPSFETCSALSATQRARDVAKNRRALSRHRRFVQKRPKGLYLLLHEDKRIVAINTAVITLS